MLREVESDDSDSLPDLTSADDEDTPQFRHGYSQQEDEDEADIKVSLKEETLCSRQENTKCWTFQ